MKRIFVIAVVALIGLPVFAAETETKAAPSAKYFTGSSDPRFQYDLPSGLKFKKNSEAARVDDNEEVTLDATNVKPTKTVIKKLESSPDSTTQPQDVPMNYDSFPKFYDGNDLMQQVIPMY